MRNPGRWLRTLVLALAVLLLTGCQARLAVEVLVDREGGGVLAVSLAADGELLAQAEAAGVDPLGDVARSGTRLVDEGWRVTDEPTGDGGRRIRLATAFSSPEQLAQLADDLSEALGGPEVVPLEDLRIAVEDDRVRLSGVAGLVPTEEVEALGLQPDQAVALVRDNEALRYEVSAVLPGEIIEANADGVEGRRLTWRIEPGQQVELTAVAQRPASRWWVLAVAGALGGGLALALLALLRRRGSS